jgi:hypothetical protein
MPKNTCDSFSGKSARARQCFEAIVPGLRHGMRRWQDGTVNAEVTNAYTKAAVRIIYRQNVYKIQQSGGGRVYA